MVGRTLGIGVLDGKKFLIITALQVIKAVKVGLELLYPFVTKIYVNKLQSTVVTQMYYVYKD